jgi:hypothetical protein
MMSAKDYISAKRFAAACGFHPYAAKKVAAAAGIRVRQVPGLSPRYCREDVDRLARDLAGSAHPAEHAGELQTAAAGA